MPTERLPYIDEHAVDISAGVDDAWPALLDALDRSFSRPGSAWYARIIGCTDSTASGPRPLAEGSTVPGFRVAVATPGRELVLVGGHHFSLYQLAFRLEPLGPGRSRLRAESRAAFPGLAGGAYRLLVIGSGVHVRAVRSMVRGIARDAEQRASARIPT
jgi:hypothetical protein